ncbi:MAG: hypothetical protein PHS24_04630 [Bacilli bacterium]|nr:hypothetical protein [Bacilli bacterium]
MGLKELFEDVNEFMEYEMINDEEANDNEDFYFDEDNDDADVY